VYPSAYHISQIKPLLQDKAFPTEIVREEEIEKPKLYGLQFSQESD
jgi:hypothetical protein